jgi:tetratricopeptide (TPR) repeat protein
VTVKSGEWGLTLRPQLDAEQRHLYDAGQAAAGREEKAKQWLAAAALARESGQRITARWLFAEAGRVWAEADKAEPAEAAFREAMALADDDITRGQIASAQGRAFLRSGETYDRGEEMLREALRLRESKAPNSLATAAAWQDLAECLLWRGDFGLGVEAAFRRALELRETLAPNSLAHAASLNSAAFLEHAASRADSAEALVQCALQIAEAIEPRGVVAARAHAHLARVAWARGRLQDSIEQLQMVI